MRSKTLENQNSFLLALFLFINILVFPLTQISNSSLFFWSTIIGLTIYSIIINRVINRKLIIILIFTTLIFFLNALLVPYSSDVITAYLKFFRFGILSLYLASLVTDYKSLIKYMFYLSIISIVILITYIDLFQAENRYMDLGVYLTYCFIGVGLFYFSRMKKGKVILLSILWIELLLILSLGNRSSFIIAILILIILSIKTINVKKLADLSYLFFKASIYTLIFILLTQNIQGILAATINKLEEMGYYSYSLIKISTLFQGNSLSFDEQSSGRDDVYENAVEHIINSNFMPNGVMYYSNEISNKFTYPHNIFLEVGLDFGLFGIISFLIGWAYLFYKFYLYRKGNFYFDLIITAFIIYSFTRLMFSGSYWEEPFYWVCIGLIIFYKDSKVMRCKYDYFNSTDNWDERKRIKKTG